jgi:hypothetical protein
MTPQSLQPGPETLAIRNFTRSASWEGRLPAGALGLDAPEMSTKGHMHCKWTVNGLWLVCEIEDVMTGGDHSRVWKAVWVAGWDFGFREYRGAIFDSFGNSSMMRGVLEDQKLRFESMSDIFMHGQPTRLRFTFDTSDPTAKGVRFTAEHSVDGAYVVDEREIHVPTE